MAVFLNRNKRPQAAPIEVAELLSEKPPPSHFFIIVPLSRQDAAALSAAVTTSKYKENAPNSHGRVVRRKDTTGTRLLFGREREGGERQP